ncbi:MAG: SDR family oxidoreductase [Pseudomonadales bacterium]
MSLSKNHVAIVTGAGQGVGRGIARAFAKEGATVVVAEINAETGNAVANELSELGGEGVFIQTDMGDQESVETLIADTISRCGHLDTLVNNAYFVGNDLPKRLETRDTEDFEKAMNVGFYGALWAMWAAFEHMRERGFGRIINLCSLNGVNSHPFTTNYNITKEALRTLSRSSAREWAQHKITVNTICPAAVSPAFEMLKKFAPQEIDKIVTENPMGYMGDAEADIGGVAVFLASDVARYLTGNTLFADGGSHINGVSWVPPLMEEM